MKKVNPPRVKGFIRWFDLSGDQGILSDFDGNEHFFNSWSFPETHYLATGKCKKTGRQKTVKTRHYPGLWINFKEIMDPTCIEIQYKHFIPVEFEDAGVSPGYNWAVKIKMRPDLQKEVFDHRLESSMNVVYYGDVNPMWQRYGEKQLDHLLQEVWDFEDFERFD